MESLRVIRLALFLDCLFFLCHVFRLYQNKNSIAISTIGLYTSSMATKKPRKTTPTKRKAVKKNQVKSFQITKSDVPFMTMKPSIQTLYWVILGVVVVFFTVWILKLQADIQAVYDSIDANENLVIDAAPTKKNSKN